MKNLAAGIRAGREIKMALISDILTLEARHMAGQDVVTLLAKAYAQMIVRKNSKRLIWDYFDRLADLLKKAERYHELIAAAGDIDPSNLGVWDCQKAVEKWLHQGEEL